MPVQAFDSENRAKAPQRTNGSYATTAVDAYESKLLPAFPGAEGFGRWSAGGRFGATLVVTNNLDYANNELPIAGSLRWAISQNVPRTILFRLPAGTSGNIDLKDGPLDNAGKIQRGTLRLAQTERITVAGQSGDPGVCITRYGFLIDKVQHAIVRFFRSRPGSVDKQDAMGIKDFLSDHIIVDHCSTTWGTDETLSVDRASRISLQWNLIADSTGGEGHNYGTLLRGLNNGSSLYSVHHNFWARHKGRMPRIGGDPYTQNDNKSLPGGLMDIRNNVIWQWGSYAMNSDDYYKWDRADNRLTFDAPVRFNFVNNYYWDDSDALQVMKESSPFSSGHYAGNSKGNWIVPDQSGLVDYQCLDALSPSGSPALPDDKKGSWLFSGYAADLTLADFNLHLPSRPQRNTQHGLIPARDLDAYIGQGEFPTSDPVTTGPAGASLFSTVVSGADGVKGVGASLHRDPVDTAILGNIDSTSMALPPLAAAQPPMTQTATDFPMRGKPLAA